MDRTLRTDVADVLVGIGRHWGWVLAFGIVTLLAGLAALAVVLGLWLLVYGAMEVGLAFQLRSVGRAAAPVATAT